LSKQIAVQLDCRNGLQVGSEQLNHERGMIAARRLSERKRVAEASQKASNSSLRTAARSACHLEIPVVTGCPVVRLLRRDAEGKLY
jgi:hypothetical protein